MGLVILFALAAALLVVVGAAALIYRMEHPHRLTTGVALARKMPTEPTELGLSGLEVTFELSDGSTSPGWVLDGGRPDGPMVVLVHGWSTGRYSALNKAKRLWPHASSLVLFDLRGHGDSSARTCTFGARERDDIAAVVEQADAYLRPRKGEEGSGELHNRSVVLFGSSMGAGLALAAAVQGPESLRRRVVGVIADGPYRMPMEPIAGHLRHLGWPTQPFCLIAGLYLAVRYGPRVGVFDRARLAAQFPHPLLVLHGCDDPICPIDSARQIATAAPQGRLVEFEDGGHGGLAHVDETRYTDALAAFFESITTEARRHGEEKEGDQEARNSW